MQNITGRFIRQVAVPKLDGFPRLPWTCSVGWGRSLAGHLRLSFGGPNAQDDTTLLEREGSPSVVRYLIKSHN